MVVSGGYILVMVTCPTREEAEKITRVLLERRLAACINIVYPVKSMFWWENKIDSCDEALLIIKSRINLFRELTETIKKLHSYTTPEIIMIPIIAGYTGYLEWIDKTLKQ
ncbi:MAG TPA: divalent-cation tolerance protein CutA [Desulfurococcales archaeon]|nr:divalent-cation tolerance protein CutA [Desulfurococcales archaeon]